MAEKRQVDRSPLRELQANVIPSEKISPIQSARKYPGGMNTTLNLYEDNYENLQSRRFEGEGRYQSI